MAFSTPLYTDINRLPAPVQDWIVTPSVSSKKAMFRYWYLNVANFYVGSKLTYPTDKFRALDGTLNVIQQYMPGLENKAGLWVEDLHSGLAWATQYIRATKYNEHVAPSWSWGNLDLSGSGITRKVSNGTPNHGMQQYLYDARLVDFCTPLAGIKSPSLNDPTTSVEDFALEISNECCSVCSCNIPEPFLDIRSDPDEGIQLFTREGC
ncbi:uncharacterized protein LY89DRAFT_435005 [Mollisia scopiformis]|uniref:Uncharacterized protein n=1 Tax=Mollisia scopiformis TaxID=149040 RepID=A0A194XMH5_MOLSC|nr:uncharacterized protein LY89DRAFT_435005 [Mollisia scopiformis]KUJ21455.1 hypothetical protein LY89DRAFT_435005 [Mollisia scopiformis]